jgi:hypothetical protein
MIDRELLVKALTARRLQQAYGGETELLYLTSTHNGEWAEQEADALLGHMNAQQGGDQ